MSIRILIADDHEIMREGLTSLINRQEDMVVIGEARDGLEAVKLAQELNPDIVIMDINMPDMDGIDATRQIRKHNPDIKIICLSMYESKRLLTDMFRAGAMSYILKEQAFKDLAKAIKAVINNQTYLCPKMTDMVVQDFRNRIINLGRGKQISCLSELEIDVLRQLCEGKSSKEIALNIYKSSKTVDAYRRQIMNKLKINNMADLVKFAIREGIIDMDD